MTYNSDEMGLPEQSKTEASQEPPMESWARQCPLFWDMSQAEWQEVRDRLVSQVYSKNDIILREGKTFQVLWFIVRGECEVFKTVKPGTEQRLCVLNSGSVFGEVSFFQAAPHSASVRTITEVEVMRLTRDQFDELEASGSTAVNKILLNTVKVLAERLRRMDDWTCELVERPDGTESQRKEWRDFRSKLYTDWHF